MEQIVKMKPSLLLIMATTWLVASAGFDPLVLVDLSHPHGPDVVPGFPGGPRYKLTPFFAGTLQSGIYVEQNYFITSGLTGTHIDTPAFIIKGGTTVDKIPLESTVAHGVVIDCTKEASEQRGYEVPVQKVLDWEKVNGRIPDGAAVIFHTGWSLFFDNPNLYRGTDDIFNTSTYYYPTVAPETGRFLLEERNMSILAIDSYAVDPVNGQNALRPNHHLLLTTNCLIVEDLTNLDKLPSRGFIFSAAPVKYVGSSAPQVRAYALSLNKDENCRCDEPSP